MNDRNRGTDFFVLFILVAAAAVGALLWYIPERRSELRADNERTVSYKLKSLASCEADFRANDRDGNGINDFWTGDLAGVFRGTLGREDREMAEADTDPLVPLCPKPVPFHGYFFVALQLDNSPIPPVRYRQETDEKSGQVHNLERFGFLAYPSEPGVSGNYYFMINENNTVFRAPATIPLPKDWPPDPEIRKYWCKPH